jgi:putative copper export protein
MTDVLLVTVHAGTAAVWLGAMVYSLLVVQPRAAAALEDPEPG